MRKIAIYISLLLITSFSFGQILTPLGKGLNDAPDKIVNYKNGVSVAYINKYGYVNLKYWNGHFWSNLPTPDFDRFTYDNPFRIADLYSTNNDLYLAISYKNPTSATPNQLIRWDGKTWNSFSSSVINTSITLDKIFEEDGIVKCIGKFTENNTKANIISFENDEWHIEGNLVTTNEVTDQFYSIAVTNNQVLATGRFTNPLSNVATLAEWDGNKWAISELPPFLGENIALGNYNEEIVVFGKSDFDDKPIKVRVNGQWQNMSNGLEDYKVNTVNQFAQIDGQLFAIGEFISQTNSETENLLIYDGVQWSKTKLNLSDIEQIYSFNDAVFVSGDFSDNARIKGIGAIRLNQAQITARVYHDKDMDCEKDPDENWLPYYPISSNSNDISFFTDAGGQLYLPVSKNNYIINAAEYDYYQATCPDLEIVVDEYRTYYGAALGVNKTPNVADLSVQISDNESYVTTQGEVRKATVCIENKGSLFASNETFTINLGSGLAHLTSDFEYDFKVGNKYQWTINLDAEEVQCFQIEYTVIDLQDASLQAEVIVLSDKDKNTSNNTSQIKYKKGQAEPNSKHCDNGEIVAPGTVEMSYKIGFTNQSSRIVDSLKIVDYLDPALLISARGISYLTSHNKEAFTDVELLLTEDNRYRHKIITTLKQLQLPPQSIDEAESKGFVEYNLNVRPLKKGIQICNTATIYFYYENGVYGEPLNTNEVCTSVGEVLSNDDPTLALEKYLEIGPNPVSSTLNIKNKSNESYRISIVNTLGQSVHNDELKANGELQIEVQDLSPGVYTIFSNGLFTQKFIIH